MDGVDQHLTLPVSAVGQLNLSPNGFRVGILGLGHRNLKGNLLVKAQRIQSLRKVLTADL